MLAAWQLSENPHSVSLPGWRQHRHLLQRAGERFDYSHRPGRKRALASHAIHVAQAIHEATSAHWGYLLDAWCGVLPRMSGPTKTSGS